MGISRDSRHKRRLTGGRRKIHQKKRKFELARPAASTKLGTQRVRPLRVRGGATKFRALRLEAGNFSWGSESFTHTSRIVAVSYNASNNELVRTQTLVKNAVIQVDATPFKNWYESQYAVEIGKKKKEEEAKAAEAKAPLKGKPLRHLKARQATRVLDPHLQEQFLSGRLYAVISSRPGQSGRADGYILEGEELAFYTKKMSKKTKAKQ